MAHTQWPIDYEVTSKTASQKNILSQEIFCHKHTFQNDSIVKREGRWMVPMDEYPANHYPSFCSGSGFIISRNASEKLFETAKVTDNFRFPDVHLTGILRLKSKIPNPVETTSGPFSFELILETWYVVDREKKCRRHQNVNSIEP